MLTPQGSYWAIDTNPKEDTVPSRPKKRPRSGERVSGPHTSAAPLHRPLKSLHQRLVSQPPPSGLCGEKPASRGGKDGVVGGNEKKKKKPARLMCERLPPRPLPTTHQAGCSWVKKEVKKAEAMLTCCDVELKRLIDSNSKQKWFLLIKAKFCCR